MNLISAAFLGLVIISLILYYILPLKIRWVVLSGASIYFIFSNNRVQSILIICVTMAIVYTSAMVLENIRQNKLISQLILWLTIFLVGGCLIFLKDIRFFINLTGTLEMDFYRGGNTDFETISRFAPLGISYYTLTWIGYVLNVYWGIQKAEKNPLKFVLFAGYFPLLVSGPIIRYSEVQEQLLRGNRFNERSISLGVQRILWGIFKKLIISERCAVIVNAVYADYNRYAGIYVWVAVIMFVFQLYTDFSGCMDIVLGVSQLFGVTLPENFDLPFLSRNLSEFWRRWHITLGAWLKDYIFQPLLKTALWQKIGEKTRKIFGKKTGKKIPVWMGLAISWFLIGFWHGGSWHYIFGVGLWFGFLIILGEMLTPIWEKINSLFKIKTDCFSWRLFQVLRTFFAFAIGLSFFRSYGGLKEGFQLWKAAFSLWDPWIFFDGSLYNIGLDAKDWGVLLIALGILAGTGIARLYTKCHLREWLEKQNLFFRWIIWYGLIFSIFIFGNYGTEYDTQAFIYQMF